MNFVFAVEKRIEELKHSGLPAPLIAEQLGFLESELQFAKEVALAEACR